MQKGTNLDYQSL